MSYNFTELIISSLRNLISNFNIEVEPQVSFLRKWIWSWSWLIFLSSFLVSSSHCNSLLRKSSIHLVSSRSWIFGTSVFESRIGTECPIRWIIWASWSNIFVCSRSRNILSNYSVVRIFSFCGSEFVLGRRRVQVSWIVSSRSWKMFFCFVLFSSSHWVLWTLRFRSL